MLSFVALKNSLAFEFQLMSTCVVLEVQFNHIGCGSFIFISTISLQVVVLRGSFNFISFVLGAGLIYFGVDHERNH